MKIPKDSWNIIEKVIRRYPANCRKQAEMLEDAMTRTPAGDRRPQEPGGQRESFQSSVEAAAIKMSSEYYERIRREIRAVRSAYVSLRLEERKVVAARYWTDPERNIPFLKITGVHYSERQMKRICKKMILAVGKRLGEIEG